jgi:hypothetical protein
MIAEILSGMLLVLTLGMIIIHINKKGLKVRIGGWIFIGFTLGYSLFVLELIISFIKEGANQAALVMGGIFGFLAIILWVLLVRFILTSKSHKDEK